MNPVFIQLGQNFTTLQEQLMLIWNELIEHNLKPLAEKLLQLINDFIVKFKGYLERLQLEKLTDYALNFLQEVEDFLLDVFNRFSVAQTSMLEETTKNTIQLLKAQVIEIDQYRQSIFPIK
jgi:hypothetical protein